MSSTAGEPSAMRWIRRPAGWGRLNNRARSSLSRTASTPVQKIARSSSSFFAMLDVTAKPRPSNPPDRERMRSLVWTTCAAVRTLPSAERFASICQGGPGLGPFNRGLRRGDWRGGVTNPSRDKGKHPGHAVPGAPWAPIASLSRAGNCRDDRHWLLLDRDLAAFVRGRAPFILVLCDHGCHPGPGLGEGRAAGLRARLGRAGGGGVRRGSRVQIGAAKPLDVLTRLCASFVGAGRDRVRARDTGCGGEERECGGK